MGLSAFWKDIGPVIGCDETHFAVFPQWTADIAMATEAPIQTKEQFGCCLRSGMDIGDPVWHSAMQSWWHGFPANDGVCSLMGPVSHRSHVWEQTAVENFTTLSVTLISEYDAFCCFYWEG